MHGRMPVVAPAERGRQFPWWRDIGVAVQNVTDLVRVLLVHARQRQLCETFGSMRIERPDGGTRVSAFPMSSVFSYNAEQGGCDNRANKLLQT